MNKEEISDYEQHPIAPPLRPAFAIPRALGRYRSHQPDCHKCNPARTDDVEGQRIRLHGINSLPEHLSVYLLRRSLGEGGFVVEYPPVMAVSISLRTLLNQSIDYA